MTIAKKTQLGLIAVSIILFVLLFLAPTISDKAPDVKPIPSKQITSIETFLIMTLKSLKPEQKTEHDNLIAKAAKNNSDTAYKELVAFWDKQKRPDFAAFFVEKIAQKKQTTQSYLLAGDRYYYAVRFIKDNNEIPALFKNAQFCYEKALSLDAKNTDAKIQLASCFVENGQDPMKGIGLLKEVEKTDSNNIKLQLTFAFFSVKSGQLDKAITRFNKVLVIDPTYIEAYLHLADAYEQQSNKAKTIEMLDKYATVTDDAMAKQEVLKYIEQLKKNN